MACLVGAKIADEACRGIIGVDEGAAIWLSSFRMRARYLDLAFSKAVMRAAFACFRSLTSSSL